MLCPHCQTEVVVTNETELCPFCKKNIMLDAKNQLAAEDCVHHILTTEDIESIESLLIEGRRTEAMRLIRKIRGKMEPLVESRVLIIIEQNSTNEQLPNRNKRDEYDEQTKPHLIPCVACGKQISSQAEACPHCGQPTGVHMCPRCNSTNTKTISGMSKATSVFLWGPFAANKVVSKFECRHCGHKW